MCLGFVNNTPFYKNNELNIQSQFICCKLNYDSQSAIFLDFIFGITRQHICYFSEIFRIIANRNLIVRIIKLAKAWIRNCINNSYEERFSRRIVRKANKVPFPIACRFSSLSRISTLLFPRFIASNGSGFRFIS